MAVLSAQTFVFADQANTKVLVGPPGSPTLSYACNDLAEMYSIMNQIQFAVESGATNLVISSTAALPGTASITVAPSSGTVLGGTIVVLSVVAPGSGTKPANGTFHQGGLVRFGGIPAETNVLNSWSVICVTPPGLAAAAVDVAFTDDRGTVTKVGAYTYN